MEDVRKKMESFEEDPSKKEDEWKKTLDSLINLNNDIKKDGTFAENESFNEIKPEDLKFLLIPYFQGELMQKFMENRDSKLELALKFYDEFYKKLDSYEYITKEKKDIYKCLTKKEDEESEKEKKVNMEELNKERSEKIQMFKYKKALSEKIKKLEKEGNYDNIRDYWISYLELCWIKMLESIKFIKLEGDSIKYIKDNKANFAQQSEKPTVKKGLEMMKITPDNLKTVDPNSKLLKNVEIKTTHHDCVDCQSHQGHNFSGVTGTDVNSVVENYTNVQQKVFKNRNPPTMTLDEFADKEIALAKEQEEKQKQFQMDKPGSDSEDEEVADRKTLEARSWDDWKDLNPKGSGNTKK